MEVTGIALDTEALKQSSQELTQTLIRLEGNLRIGRYNFQYQFDQTGR